jgi:hypothetical protein
MGIVGFAGEIQFEDKVVAHFKDGRIAKGRTRDFSPSRSSFTLTPNEESDQPETVALEDLKAVFHVKSFEGNPNHPPPAQSVGLIETDRFAGVMETGHKTAVHFLDGERLWGYATSSDENERGFFFFPTDPADNNIRIYVVNSSLREIAPFDNGE